MKITATVEITFSGSLSDTLGSIGDAQAIIKQAVLEAVNADAKKKLGGRTFWKAPTGIHVSSIHGEDDAPNPLSA